MHRVISLVSGGLDSLLAGRIMQELGFDVEPVHLVGQWGCNVDAVEIVERQLKTPVTQVSKGSAFISLVRKPKYGYGKNMNPCIDCRIQMFQIVASLVEERGAVAVVTGEVVGQRPMSQMMRQIELIESHSTLEGLILRPLSAQLLPPTVAEENGIVNREQLYDINGRSRTRQMELAKQFGVTEYPTPGGGCKLTTSGFTPRLEDFLEHYTDDDSDDARLLNYGRHLRVNENLKLIVGRWEEDNDSIAEYIDTNRTLYVPENFNGPSVLACGSAGDEVDKVATGAMLRYVSHPQPTDGYRVTRNTPSGLSEISAGEALSHAAVDAMLLSTDKAEVPMAG
jgi:tRNA-uridine 2-sulfurtransferase